MANNDQKINIDIQSTANTAGVDKADAAVQKLKLTEEDYANRKAAFLAGRSEREVAEIERIIAAQNQQVKSLFGVESATESVGRAQDVLEAKSRLAARTVTASGVQMKNFGSFVNQAGFQVTDFAVQVQGGPSVLTAFSQQFPQLIGGIQQSGIELGKINAGLLSMPIGIATAISVAAVGIGIGAKLAGDAYDKMKAAEADLAKARERAVKQIEFQTLAMEQLRDAERSEFIASVYERELTALKEQEETIRRINEIRAAQGSTAEAQANLAITQAQNSGGNVSAAQGNAIGVGVSNRIAEIQGQLQTAEATAQQATLKLAEANSLLAAEALKGDANLQSFKEANAAFDKAQAAKDSAVADLDLQRQKYEESLKQLDANTDASLSTLTTQANANQTQRAQETLAALQAKSAEVGGNLSSNAKQAIQDLTKALADGFVSANESPLVVDAIKQVRASREGSDQRLIAAVGGLVTAQETVNKILPALEARIAKIEADARSFNISTRF